MRQFVEPGYRTTLQVLIHFARKEMQGHFCSKRHLAGMMGEHMALSFPPIPEATAACPPKASFLAMDFHSSPIPTDDSILTTRHHPAV